MKTSDPETFCPYPGLRSFTEEESIYFKGREEQVDQVCALLQGNKFLMVTGASGEGKSSLIYAGLIPNARAGFFKARYTNWLVADFRPERTPLRNMAEAVGASLEKDTDSVETELRRGFASLVDLYKNSRFFVEGKDLSLAEKRQAANLLIIVDQFEEFFTNPENYFNETTSVESQTVVNLALETARIAQHDNLPIYVVCTMRSDYIGQCSSFRGLPEFIGYSQFFVPRLKRKDLIQVIEEPAVLSGNRITRRLVERLVYDLADGIDQLPILQHALSQVWHAADQGRSEMDLLHYAKVGGMPAQELPADQREEFSRWFASLPERRQKSYEMTGLNRVIEIHADRLYESAYESLPAALSQNAVSEKDTKFILALTFACLTRIDHSRAVRNRMTLREITAIINKPHLTEDVVAAVINPYRLEENAFVRPFAVQEHVTITSDTVLDITHESLIRNWTRLKKWADQEFEYYTTLQDFKKQLGRWKEHGRSAGFLLPIGPLSYYENWIAKCNPNPHWINRYSERKDDPATALQESQSLFGDMKQFVAASARKVWLQRTWMKYGTARLAAVATALVLIILSGYFLYDANRKRNAAVMRSVEELGLSRLASDAVNVDTKMQYLMHAERLEPGSFFTNVKRLTSPRERIEILVHFLRNASFADMSYTIPIRTAVLDTLLVELSKFKRAGTDPAFALTQTNLLLSMMIETDYYHSRVGLAPRIQSLAAGIPGEVRWYYEDVSRFSSGISAEINYALHLWLAVSQPDAKEIQQFIDRVSPFGAAPSPVFGTYYRIEIEDRNGRFPIRFGGGYHLLASLYAAAGQTDGVIRCFEAIKSDANYFTGSLFNNYTQVIGFLYKYGHRDRVPSVLTWLAANFPTDTPTSVLRNTVIRAGYRFRLFPGNYTPGAFRAFQGYYQPVLWLLDRTYYAQLCEDFAAEIQKIKSPDERNHLMATQLKRRALMTLKYNYDRKLPVDSAQLNMWLDQAWDYYGKVGKSYLEEIATLNYPYWGDGVRAHQWPRKWFFIYPDYMDGWFADTYLSDFFFRHADRGGMITRYYAGNDDYDLLHYWVSNYLIPEYDYRDGFNHQPLPLTTLKRVIAVGTAGNKNFDANLITLVLAKHYFEKGDTANAMIFARQYRPDQFLRSVSRYEYMEKTWLTNLVMQLTANLAVIGKSQEAKKIAESLYRPIDKLYAYWYASLRLYQSDYDPASFAFLDSALSKAKAVSAEQLPGPLDYRNGLLISYGTIGGSAMNARALEVLRDLPDGGPKFFGQVNRSVGLVYEDNYFEAFRAMPSNLTEQQEMFFCFALLDQIAERRERRAGDKTWSVLHKYSDPHIFFYPN